MLLCGLAPFHIVEAKHYNVDMLKVYTSTLVISDAKHLLRDVALYVVNRLIVNVLLETLPNILSRAMLDRIATLSQVTDLTFCTSA